MTKPINADRRARQSAQKSCPGDANEFSRTSDEELRKIIAEQEITWRAFWRDKALLRTGGLLGVSSFALTQHYGLAAAPPALTYAPWAAAWKHRRYRRPATTWMQGLAEGELNEQLEKFMSIRTHAARLLGVEPPSVFDPETLSIAARFVGQLTDERMTTDAAREEVAWQLVLSR